METKSIDHYFKTARSIPIAMSLEKVQALVKINGVPTTHQSWWKTKNFIFMTTAAIIIMSGVILLNSSTGVEQTQITNQKEVENNIIQPVLKKTKKENKTTVIPVKTQSVEKKIEPLVILQEEVTVFGSKPKIESKPLIELADPVFIMSNNNTSLINVSEPQYEIDGQTKIITKELSATSVDLVVVKNYKGDINIETWDKPIVQMEAFVTISGGNDDDIEKALEDFDLSLIRKGNKIEIENEWSKHQDCNCVETSIKGKIVTKKGEKIRVKKYKIDYVITVPKKINLELKDSYGDIVISDIDGDVKATSFQGDLTVGNITGSIDLNEKYGNVVVGNFSEGEIKLFHAEADFGSSQNIELDAKYSDVTFLSVHEIEMCAFQSDIEIEKEVKKVTGKIKYGDLILENNASYIEINVFQAKVELEAVEEIEISGSYTNFKAKSIGRIFLEKSFQNSYRIETVSSIKGDSKYTSFDIGILKNELDLETFQGSIDVDEILGIFSKLDIDSKYTPIDLSFSKDAKFNLKAETTYADFDYPKNAMQVEEEDIAHQKKNFKGVFNANNNKEPSLVNVVCFQGKLNLR
ncbi:MAG: hypothetical protein COB15_16295 [Flavobacteriales bacterium]|nr:MAG: hypothetical protein COB15_16295 [Flavobacteriales bacterium]